MDEINTDGRQRTPKEELAMRLAKARNAVHRKLRSKDLDIDKNFSNWSHYPYSTYFSHYFMSKYYDGVSLKRYDGHKELNINKTTVKNYFQIGEELNVIEKIKNDSSQPTYKVTEAFVRHYESMASFFMNEYNADIFRGK